MEDRILALDVGDRRVGLAASDPMGIIASGLPTLHRKSIQYDMEFIKKAIDEKDIKVIVVGLPLNMNGTKGPQAEKTIVYADEIRKIFDGEIVFRDERLTSVGAHNVMHESGLKRKKHKGKVDELAAVLILQNYMTFLKSSRR